MNTASKNRPAATQRTALRRICFVANGNAHAPLPAALPRHCVSEAMLPNIRTTAMMIAAARRNPDARSPSHFSDDADWFAARILVLGVRVFHLPPQFAAVLEQANRRARAFAQTHGLAFRPARLCPAASNGTVFFADCDAQQSVKGA
ncbi:hypothetical protein [Conchiformibius kuhniae]|uniref:Uncharacterized protein n=2 Tax=Conchiformibius kuhniae TaxID=211502 RepID=A0ABD8B8A1_9NEIS|nr:hypothetical protein [Conchiformibius kuhniae]